ncbi:MFS transporter [Zavarzinella formosa]|uniref:MFS transporter n=1 Tax=Zavarzinella formosa TaxID=360055 RepID=UPI000594621C|nr:MFS transporter [Zavarzinella formosa]
MLATTRRLHPAWTVAGATFLILLATAGVRSTPGVLIVPLEREFGWSRATISVAVSVNLFLYGLIGPFAAALMDRLGVRKTVLISLATVTAGVSLTTHMSASWQLVMLWGVVVGGGTGMTALVLATTVVNRWFVTRRGLVLGVLTASSATGQLVFLPLMAALVEHFGWRAAAFLVAGALVLVIPLVALFLREHPSDLGVGPYGGELEPVSIAVPKANPALEAIRGLRDGFRSRDFWLLSGSFFVCGASTNGLIGTHLIPACLDQGIPEVTAAGLLALMGLFDLAGTTASGWLSDRLDNRTLLSWYYALRGLSLICLPFGLADASWGLTIFAVFYGLDWIATVPPTVRLTADTFGRARAAIMFGWIVAAHQCGAAVAAFGAGAIRSWSGNYERAFLTSGALCLVTAAMVLQIRRPVSVSKEEPLPEPEAISPAEAVA